MSRISLKWFGGMIPRRGEQHLPKPLHATEAENCNLYSGELRPLKQPALSHQFCRPTEECWRSPLPEDPSGPLPPEPPQCVPVTIGSTSPAYDLGDSTTGTQLILTVTVNSDATMPVQYQWYRNGIAIAGAVDPTLLYTVTGEDSYSTFTVSVQNPCGFEVSGEWSLGFTGVICKTYECDALEQLWRNRNRGDELFWPGFQWTRYPGVWSLKYWDGGGYVGGNPVPINSNLRNYLAASPEQFNANVTPPGAWAPGDIPKYCQDYGVLRLANVSQAWPYLQVPDPTLFDELTVSGSYAEHDLKIRVWASAALWLTPTSLYKASDIFSISFDGWHSYGFGSDVSVGIQDMGSGLVRFRIGGQVIASNIDLTSANKLQMVTISAFAEDVPNPSYPAKNAYKVTATLTIDGVDVASGSYTRYDTEGWNIYLVRLNGVRWYGQDTYAALFSVAGGNDTISIDEIYEAWQRQFENYVDPTPGCSAP